MTTVLALWRYPVKSMQGESVAEAAIEVGGIVGDREWALVDQQTGLGLTARREPRLLFAQAATVADDVVITLPDGVETTDAAVLSRWLDREVALVRAAPETVGTFEIGLAEGDDADSDPSVEWFQWQGPRGRFHDSTRTQVSIIGTETVGPWDMRRFRPNVVVGGTGEDDWVGHEITLGAVRLDVVKQIDRCVITTREQPDGIARDVDVLRTINRERSGNLGIGTLVLTPGTVRVGDPITSA